ncbi:hypothetical protein CYY_009033 [Polysphondylium violaceum]|uniref:Homeobox domain-containing protein n=1 Tax=Polysphondylium violaceum TaxID=133409 RepID=A0A8J4PMA8_9MYCE|nr:hypothetical protein CYY_009033 [Polysphondylium violaceum]
MAQPLHPPQFYYMGQIDSVGSNYYHFNNQNGNVNRYYSLRSKDYSPSPQQQQQQQQNNNNGNHQRGHSQQFQQHHQQHHHQQQHQYQQQQQQQQQYGMMNSSLNNIGGAFDDDPMKKKRKRISPEQLRILEKIFVTHQHPTLNLRKQLAIELSMTPRSVQIWFQNRRAKARHMEFKPQLSNGISPDLIYDAIGYSSSGQRFINGTEKVSIASTWNRILSRNSDILLQYNPDDPSSIDVNARDSKGMSLLFSAAFLGYEYQVRRLIESGANSNIQDNQGNTPMIAASALGSELIVDFLLENRADPNIMNDDGISPLYAACKGGYVSIVQSLVDRQSEVSVKTFSKGETPLHIASLKGYDEICKILLENDAKATVYDLNNQTPLHHASIMGYYPIVKLLVQYGADKCCVDKDGRTPLHSAALMGHDLIVKYLIENGSNPNIQDNDGYLPIHYAVRESRSETVKLLIQLKSLLNLKTKSKQNLLHLSAQYTSLMMGQTIFESDTFDLDQMDENLSTPLYLAAKAGKTNFVKYLIAKGASKKLAIDKLLLDNEDQKEIIQVIEQSGDSFEKQYNSNNNDEIDSRNNSNSNSSSHFHPYSKTSSSSTTTTPTTTFKSQSQSILDKDRDRKEEDYFYEKLYKTSSTNRIISNSFSYNQQHKEQSSSPLNDD